MSKTITLNLNKGLIMEAVKAETYDSARINKAGDPVKNAPAAMSEQAGGENHQERQLLRYIKQAVAKFESQMGEFLDAGNGTIGNTLSAEQDPFTITMVVNNRYNDGMKDPMAGLAEDYIINTALFTWWNSRSQEFAKQFILMAQDDIEHVRLCLTKTAPESSSVNYTDITGTVTGGDGIVSISFPQAEYTATVGQPFTSPQAITTPNGLSLAYSSSDTSVATVDESGNVTILSAGTANITARFGGNNDYRPASGSYHITVNS